MRKIVTLFALIGYILLSACGQDNAGSPAITFISPEAGTTIRSGSTFQIRLDFASERADSIIYILDSTVVARKTDTTRVSVSTANLPMGLHLVTARVYRGTEAEDVISNIVLVAANPPQQYTYRLINTFPHDTSSYVQGLEYHDGILYESDGEHGGSSIRRVDLRTGRVLQKVDIPEQYFAEGLAVVGDKIIQLTYQEKVGFVYNKNTLEKLEEFPYNAAGEGWGLCFDGKRLLSTDGSNSIYILNKDTYQKEGTLEVYDHQGPVDQLNEIEMVNGKIYANLYRIDAGKIIIINPQSGVVEGEINLKPLIPQEHADDTDYILNGIAWDAAGKRLFVTGKKWDKLYEIEVVRQ